MTDEEVKVARRSLLSEVESIPSPMHELLSAARYERDELRNAYALASAERDEAKDRADKMHLLGLKLARELADLERENASLRRRLREGGR